MMGPTMKGESMTDYKPGTVAVATVLGEPNVRVFRLGDVDDVGDWALDRDIDGLFFSDIAEDKDVTDIRPLVVLDLGAGDALALIADLRQFVGTDLAKNVADQIEEQTRPPRIPEPGLWGVVEAKAVNDDRRIEWVHGRATDAGNDWHSMDGMWSRVWSDLVDPVLIREGVEG